MSEYFDIILEKCTCCIEEEYDKLIKKEPFDDNSGEFYNHYLTRMLEKASEPINETYCIFIDGGEYSDDFICRNHLELFIQDIMVAEYENRKDNK